MILKLYFELEKNTLPSDYSPAFLSMIKNALSYSCEELYNSYYENNKSKEKNFCFAVRLPAPKFQNDKIELGDTNGDMQIHILDPEDAIDFYNAFMSQKNKSYPFPNGNKIKITKIEMRNHKTVTSNTILIKMNSPLLVRCHENGKDMYLSYKDENFQKYFFMSAAHTIKEILNIETPADSIHIEPVDARKTVVNTFGSKITGNIGIFKLTGSLTLLNTLIQQDSAADVLKVLAVLRSLWRCEQLLENCLKTELGSSFMLNAGICGFIRFMEHNNAEKGKDYDYQGQSLFIDIDYLKNNDISEMYISTMSEIFEENTKHFRTLNEKHEIDKLNSIGIDNLDDKQKKRITELYKNFADLLVKSSYLSAYEMLSDVDSITPINKDIIEDFKKESDLSVKHEKYNNIYQIINQKRLKDFLIYTELIYTSLKFFFSENPQSKKIPCLYEGNQKFTDTFEKNFIFPLLEEIEIPQKKKSAICIECIPLKCFNLNLLECKSTYIKLR